MRTIIVDVRSEKEFSEGTYPGAVNIPSTKFNTRRFEAFRNNHIALVCFSGKRAKKVKASLDSEGFEQVSLLQNQMVHIAEGSNANSAVWTVDRQFRLALGILLGVSLAGIYLFNTSAYVILLIGLFAGLMYSSITDNCYLKALISAMPWNKRNTIYSSAQNQEIITA